MINIPLPEHWVNWKLTEEIGMGAYGKVFRAEISDEDNDDVILSAIKIIHIPKDDAEASMLYREYGSIQKVSEYYAHIVTDLVNEIQTMMSLKGCRNIVQIEDYHVQRTSDNEYGWVIYIRMEYLHSFTEYLQVHEFPESDVIKLGIDICMALEECEKVGIIHRDIKPDNILIADEGYYKLGDFGVSKKLSSSNPVFSIRGTYIFMAPEVYHGNTYDHTADIYSLGLVLFRLLNRNRDPFVNQDKQIILPSEIEIALGKRMEGAQIPAPSYASDAMAEIITKACAFDPKDRFQSAALMREALEKIQNDTDDFDGNSKVDHPTTKKDRDDKKIPFAIFFCMIITGLILLGFYVFTLNYTRKNDTYLHGSSIESKQQSEAASTTDAAKEITTETVDITEATTAAIPTLKDPEGLQYAENIVPLKYNGHVYAIFNYHKLGLQTFDECEQFCENIGGHLAVINTEEENIKVYNYLVENDRDHTFIGYTNEGNWEWRWVDDSKDTYHIWAKGQPSRYDQQGREEHYAQYNGKDQGTLNDAKFGKGSGSYRFLCEWDMD